MREGREKGLQEGESRQRTVIFTTSPATGRRGALIKKIGKKNEKEGGVMSEILRDHQKELKSSCLKQGQISKNVNCGGFRTHTWGKSKSTRGKRGKKKKFECRKIHFQNREEKVFGGRTTHQYGKNEVEAT